MGSARSGETGKDPSHKTRAGMLVWPPAGSAQSSALGGAGGFINFFAQHFHLTSDDRSESTEQGSGNERQGMIHNITLPYTNVTSTETATWDSGKNDIAYGGTDASTGIWDWGADIIYDIGEWFGTRTSNNTVNMEVSNAGFKGPVLRQRHYSWNMINRSGTVHEGRAIAGICRAFQASVYPRMSPNRTADNIVEPPPMWTTTVYPEQAGPEGGGSRVGSNPSGGWMTPGHNYDVPDTEMGREGAMKHPVSTPGAWRWGMDAFSSVLLNVSISPTSATDGVMTMTQDGWPLVTVLRCSFLEIDQCVAMQTWDGIIPYSWASNTSDGNFGAGMGGGYSPL